MPSVIAHPGTVGSFSHGAAQTAFSQDECPAYATFQAAAQTVVDAQADLALVPAEPSDPGP